MATICGSYERTLLRDEKTGYTVFSLRPDARDVLTNEFGTIRIKGVIQLLPHGAPLSVECEALPGCSTDYILNDYSIPCSSVSLQTFLASSYFPGIGEKMAKRICENIEDLQGASTEEIVSCLMKYGLSLENALQNAEKIKGIYHTKELLDQVLRFGGTFEQAEAFARFYKNDAISVLKKNPYLLTRAGVPFETCDYILMERYNVFARERIAALLRTAWEKNLAQGNTILEFSDFCRICSGIEKRTGREESLTTFYIAGALEENHFHLFFRDGKVWIQRSEWKEMEEEILRAIGRISFRHTHKTIPEEMIVQIEQQLHIRYSEEQKQAFSLLETSGVKILTGGPGTGKTTVVNGILQIHHLLYPNQVSMLCAPTGCAAKRLSETTGRTAQTIHRLLDIRPFRDGYIQSKNEQNTLEADLLVVDESSMIDTELFCMLLRAVKSGAIVLMLGDENQLPSVGPGSVLRDLLQMEGIVSCRLTQVFRQAEDSKIIGNSIRIKDGDCELQTGADFKIIRLEEESAIMEKAMEFLTLYFDPKDPLRVRLFTPVRNKKYLLGSTRINQEAHQCLIHKESDELIYGGNAYSRGEPVIFLSNNYAEGFLNGDVGVITGIFSGERGKCMEVKKDGETLYLEGALLHEIAPAYAITAHKAQGGECDTAIIVLPQEPGNMLLRNLLYVAVTRAKRKVILLTQGDAMEKAIQTAGACDRTTGLQFYQKG